MNRIILIIVVVVLCLTIQDLDARKLVSSFSNGRKQLEISRFKRQDTANYYGPSNSANYDGPSNSAKYDGLSNSANYDGLSNSANYDSPSNSAYNYGLSNSACNYDNESSCDPYLSDMHQNGYWMQQTRQNTEKRNLFLPSPSSIAELQNGGMCARNTKLFTANAYSAIDLGHVTVSELSLLNLFPVQSIDADMLLTAGYLNAFAQIYLLSALGIQACIFGHITPKQLRSLNLYPLPKDGITPDILIKGGYLTNDCVPTALGLSALHIGYLRRSDLAAAGCDTGDNSQITLEQLLNAQFIYGRLNIITPVGLAAIHTRYLSLEIYQRLNIYPFVANVQNPSRGDGYQGSTEIPDILDNLARAGYLLSRSYYLTSAAYQAILKQYLSIEVLKSLGIWPCRGKPTMQGFITAGYATYSGHLTSLGYSLLVKQYFPHDWLARLGIRLHDDYHIFFHALYYVGSFRSDYHAVHVEMHRDDNSNDDNRETPDVVPSTIPSAVDLESRFT